MADVWVADASPLIALAHAEALELLEKLSGGLLVPEAVAEEILVGPDDPARRALVAGWGTRRQTTVPQQVHEWGLGRGESAVLGLAWRSTSKASRFSMTAMLDAAPGL